MRRYISNNLIMLSFGETYQTSDMCFLFALPRWVNMPTGSVKLQSIKKLGQENHSYEVSDDGNTLLHLILWTEYMSDKKS